MSLHHSFRAPSVMAQRSHFGQQRASLRKKANKLRREQELQEEARRRGIHPVEIYLEHVAEARSILRRAEITRRAEQRAIEERERRWRDEPRRYW